MSFVFFIFDKKDSKICLNSVSLLAAVDKDKKRFVCMYPKVADEFKGGAPWGTLGSYDFD